MIVRSHITTALAATAVIAGLAQPAPSLAEHATDRAAPDFSRGQMKADGLKPSPQRFAAETSTTNAAAPLLPNGASSITETYGDWTVACEVNDATKTCILSQAQGNKETGQRAFTIELRTSKDGKTDGTILMPFGLKLDAGAILKIDDKDLGQGVRFSICVPQGCLLPVSFPTPAMDAMRKGKTLAVTAMNFANGQAVTFNVSLTGFSAALDRTLQLSR